MNHTAPYKDEPKPSPQIMSRNLSVARENSLANTVKIQRESSSNGNSATNRTPHRHSNKEKVQQMKEIKKYLDTIFKDLKEGL